MLTPLELLELLAALVPPPRYPLVRYHGVLAPHSAWRREIVPRPPTDSSTRTGKVGSAAKKESCGLATRADPPAVSVPAKAVASGSRSARASQNGADVGGTKSRACALAASGAVVRASAEDVRTAAASCHYPANVESLTPNVLSVRHWSRLLGGLLYASSSRLRWSQLLQRTFDVDVLSCANCKGRIRIVEAVVETDAARAILERLGRQTNSPRLARARDPTTLEGEEPDAA